MQLSKPIILQTGAPHLKLLNDEHVVSNESATVTNVFFLSDFFFGAGEYWRLVDDIAVKFFL